MKVKDLMALPLTQVNDVDLDREIDDVYIGDLLSDVMSNADEGTLWLTVQAHVNVVAVAHLNDFVGVIFVQNRYPDQETIARATEYHIPLFVSQLNSYQLTKQLVSLGL